MHEPMWKSLLPDPLPEPYQRPYTLVINLDDTLVHSTWDVRISFKGNEKEGGNLIMQTIKIKIGSNEWDIYVTFFVSFRANMDGVMPNDLVSITFWPICLNSLKSSSSLLKHQW